MRTALLIILIILICSCGRKNTNENVKEGSVTVIDLLSEPESEILSVSDIAADLEYLPLQTTDKSLVKSVTKVISFNNKIYLKNGFKDVLCFDKAGKFLYGLGKPGRGPGEYTFISDYDVSTDDKKLIILSDGNLLVYNISEAGFAYENYINISRFTNSISNASKISFVPGTTNILLSVDPNTGTENFLTILLNQNGDTLNCKPNQYMFENRTSFRMMVNESLHFDYGTGVYFKEEFCDTAFFVNKESNQFHPGLVFDSHGIGFLSRVRYDSEYGKAHGAEIYWVFLINETQRYVIFTYEHNRARFTMLYDKSSGKKFKLKELHYSDTAAPKKSLNDDLYGGPAFDPEFFSENLVYSSVDALTLKTFVAGDEFKNSKTQDPKKKEQLKKLADSLSETDNPVLIVVTPKK